MFWFECSWFANYFFGVYTINFYSLLYFSDSLVLLCLFLNHWQIPNRYFKLNISAPKTLILFYFPLPRISNHLLHLSNFLGIKSWSHYWLLSFFHISYPIQYKTLVRLSLTYIRILPLLAIPSIIISSIMCHPDYCNKLQTGFPASPFICFQHCSQTISKISSLEQVTTVFKTTKATYLTQHRNQSSKWCLSPVPSGHMLLRWSHFLLTLLQTNYSLCYSTKIVLFYTIASEILHLTVPILEYSFHRHPLTLLFTSFRPFAGVIFSRRTSPIYSNTPHTLPFYFSHIVLFYYY